MFSVVHTKTNTNCINCKMILFVCNNLLNFCPFDTKENIAVLFNNETFFGHLN